MIPALANCWFIEFSLRKVRYTVTSEDVYDFSFTVSTGGISLKIQNVQTTQSGV